MVLCNVVCLSVLIQMFGVLVGISCVSSRASMARSL